MLARDAIKDGFREANLTLAGKEPTIAELDEALSRLNDFRKYLFRQLLGEGLANWPVPPPVGFASPPEGLLSQNMGVDWYLFPVDNARLLVKIVQNTTVKFPMDPSPGARIAIRDVGSSAVNLTLDGNGRLIEGQQTLVDVVQALAGAEWFYRDDLASWERMDELSLDSELPLPEEYNDIFIFYTAMRMSPRNNHTISDDTRGMFNVLLRDAKARYRQRQRVGVVSQSTVEGLHSFGSAGPKSWMG